MNNSTFGYLHPFFYHPGYFSVFVPVTIFSVFTSFINFSTIYIVLRTKSLSGAGNYPIVSILLGSAIQSLITVPTYTFKRVNEGHLHREGLQWLCDFYRLPYFICEHELKVSLLLVSCDRLVATMRPYRYRDMITKKLSSVVITCSWVIVVFVDLIPFFPLGKQSDEEGCTYVPTRIWGVSVIVIFNVIVFVLTFINYGIIWKITRAMATADYVTRKSLNRFKNSNLSIRGNIIPDDAYIKLNSNHKSQITLDTNNVTSHYSSLTSSISNKDTSSNTLRSAQNMDIIGITLSPSSNKKRGRCQTWSGYDQGKRLLSPDPSIDFAARSPKRGDKGSTISTCSIMSVRIALEMKSTRTSLAIFVVYILCWGWLGIFYLVDNLCENCISKNENLLLERLLVKAVSFTSSVFLPLVYCWKTKAFRKEIKRFACVKYIVAAVTARSRYRQ